MISNASENRVGIAHVGAHVPALRLSAGQTASAWGRRAGLGRCAVADYDEDALTMAADAAILALADGAGPVDGRTAVYLGSTTMPYADKGNASVLASILGGDPGSRVMDFAGSVRAGVSGVLAALDALQARSVERAVVAAADTRQAAPGDPLELMLGHAGAALILSPADDQSLATIEATYSYSEDFADHWRRDTDRFVRAGDAKFVRDKGFVRLTVAGLQGLAAAAGIGVQAIEWVVCPLPGARTASAAARRAGVDESRVVGGSIQAETGYTGAPAPFLGLIEALQKAEPGQRIAVVGYGSGCDCLLLEVQEGVRRLQRSPVFPGVCSNARDVPGYAEYLRWRGHLEGGDASQPYTSLALLWREKPAYARLIGQECGQCGAIQYPPRPACGSCGARDALADKRLSPVGSVTSVTEDYLLPVPHPPVVMAVIDMDGGGRFYTQIVNVAAGDVAPGSRVRLSVRRLHDGGAVHHYFWKGVLLDTGGAAET